MTENEISKLVVNCAYQIHKQYGPGLYESVYEELMLFELSALGLFVKSQAPIPFIHQTVRLDAGFRADIIVESKLLIEIKSIESITAVHQKQVLTYLKLSGIKLGLLINFNVALIKQGIQRIVNGL